MLMLPLIMQLVVDMCSTAGGKDVGICRSAKGAGTLVLPRDIGIFEASSEFNSC